MESALKIKSVIGFNGKVARSLHYTPCGRYLLYPLGSFIVLKNLVTDKEAFLDGHTNNISCITLTQDGDKVASGQISISGVKVSLHILL
jgi:cilia- and flagella-associated protein 52